VVDGDLNKRIAMELGISERTVEKHRESIMEKMGTRSLAKLIQMVLSVSDDRQKSHAGPDHTPRLKLCYRSN
jgi:DNA-binding NarL/FixJ family response regulator